MTNSPLQLDRAYIESVSFDVCELTPPPSSSINITTKIDFKRNEQDPKQWSVGLRVDFKSGDDKPLTYTGHVSVLGFFTVVADMDEARALHTVAVTCPSILYGTARETVATLTGRGRHGVLLLPSVSFGDQKLIIQPEPARKAVVKD